MSYFARDEYIATGGQTEFSISFPFLDSSHISVTVNGTDASFLVTSSTNVSISSPTLLDSDLVVITRVTPHTALVAFTGGVPITTENMETQRRQFTYISEENSDTFAVPSDITSAGPFCRIRMATNTLLNVDSTSFWSDSANRIPTLDIIDNVRNTGGEVARGVNDFTLAAGFWRVDVMGSLLRDGTSSGILDAEFDLVDTAGPTRKNLMTSTPMRLWETPTASADADMGKIYGTHFFSSTASTTFELRAAKVAGGSDGVRLTNCYILAQRFGS